MDELSGFTSPNLNEAETDRALVHAARRLVVVADHSKWGIVGLSSIARLDEADVLITDDGLDAGAQNVIAGHVKRLIVVHPEPSTTDAEHARAADDAPTTVPPGLHA